MVLGELLLHLVEAFLKLGALLKVRVPPIVVLGYSGRAQRLSNRIERMLHPSLPGLHHLRVHAIRLRAHNICYCSGAEDVVGLVTGRVGIERYGSTSVRRRRAARCVHEIKRMQCVAQKRILLALKRVLAHRERAKAIVCNLANRERFVINLGVRVSLGNVLETALVLQKELHQPLACHNRALKRTRERQVKYGLLLE